MGTLKNRLIETVLLGSWEHQHQKQIFKWILRSDFFVFSLPMTRFSQSCHKPDIRQKNMEGAMNDLHTDIYSKLISSIMELQSYRSQ